MTNKELAAILRELADLLEISGENKFKVRAYHNASRRLQSINDNIKELAQNGSLKELPGIGAGIAATIQETLENGFCPTLEEIKRELPSGVLELIKIPGLGPKRAHQLFYELGIQDVDSLKNALANGRVRQLKGFGGKTEERLLKSLNEYQSYQEVIILYQALVYSERIINMMEDCQALIKIQRAGSIRRNKEVVGDIDLLAVSDKKQEVMDYFVKLPIIDDIILQGNNKSSVITEEGIQVDLRVVSSEEFPTALQYFTGSKEHNIHLRELAKKGGYKLNEYGLYRGEERIKLDSEEELYRFFKMDYIIPELREDGGEIEGAQTGKLPKSVIFNDIKGDLHMHSRYSDGAYSLEEMVQAARERGYHYIAITDHSQSLRIAHGMTPATLQEEIREIERIQEKYSDISILKGIEVDIKSDGTLDYDDDILAQLDLVIASIHTGFNQEREKITNRILKAMENPYVNIIAHPQGRILKRRSSYQLDLEKVIKGARETGTCLEINSSPYRLDLDDSAARLTREYGVKVAINTDAHHISEFDDMILGVAVARRGWLEKKDIINTMETSELLRFLRGR